jgi:hypothetical protein
MTRILSALSFVLLFHSADLFAEKVDLRNYVIGKYNANTNEVRVARQRAMLYWQKNGPRVGEKGHYLAIEAAAVMPGDVIEPLWAEYDQCANRIRIFTTQCMESRANALYYDF